MIPVQLNIKGWHVLVVGGGKIAGRKLSKVAGQGAFITQIAPNRPEGLPKHLAFTDLGLEEGGHEDEKSPLESETSPEVDPTERPDLIHWEQRAFRLSDLEGVQMVFAATDDPVLNEQIATICKGKNILVNVSTDMDQCNFHTVATIERGDLQMTLSTGGKSPALAKALKADLETYFPASAGQDLEVLGHHREEVKATVKDTKEKKRLLTQAANKVLDKWTSARKSHE